MLFERAEQVVPQRRLLGRLNLRQVEDNRCSRGAQPLVVVDHVEREVDDRRREAAAVLLAYVAVVEVQTACSENRGGEVELSPPVGDDRAPEKALRPLV